MNRLIVILICFCFACQQTNVPKPKAFLRLDYPKAKYQPLKTAMPFSFKKNKIATIYSQKPPFIFAPEGAHNRQYSQQEAVSIDPRSSRQHLFSVFLFDTGKNRRTQKSGHKNPLSSNT